MVGKGHILDANNLRLSAQEHAGVINEFRPSVVFFSLDVCSLLQARLVVPLLERRSMVVVMLGMLPTTKPKTIFDEDLADVVIRGEPESVIAQLVTLFESSKDETLARIKGSSLQGVGVPGRIGKEASLVQDLDTLPIPDRRQDHVFGTYCYENPFSRRITVIRAHRGCPYQCVYCDARKLYGASLRMRSVSHVIEEVRHCVEAGIRFISFLDHTFTLDRDWTSEFCSRMIQSGLYRRVSWIAMTRTDCVDRSLLKQMGRAGCVMLGYGLERPSQAELDRIRKGRGNRVVPVLLDTRAAGILTMGYFMMGFPGESYAPLRQFIMRLPLDFVQVSFVTPLPGTTLFEGFEGDLSDLRFLQEPVLADDAHVARRQRKLIFISFYLAPVRGALRLWRLLRHKRVSRMQVSRYAFRQFCRLICSRD
ncbi:MAG: B12-binding domain-containing radical SAM protein [Nanobdellota archaeon]